MAERRPLPWSDTCFVCGEKNQFGLNVKFEVVGERTRLNTVLDGRFEGYPGHAHGGIITALLDETIGWACSAHAWRLYFTVELTVKFKRPVPAGAPITVWGEVIKASTKIARGSGWIEDAEGTVLATATGVFFPLDKDQHDAVVAKLKLDGRAAVPADISPEG